MTPRIALSTIALTAALATGASAADRLVVLSDAMPKEQAQESYAATIGMLGALEPGQTITFVNGVDTETIAQVTVPDGDEGRQTLKHVKLKNRLLKPAVLGLKAYHKGAITAMEARAPEALPMQVNMPGMMDHARLYIEDATDLVFIGSARFYDVQQPYYTMDTKYPNDAHTIYEPSYSPYGAAGREGSLTGLRVHFCDLDEEGYYNTRQAEGLERATGLYVQAHGARLATFDADIAKCAQQAMAGSLAGETVFEHDGSTTPLIFDASLPAATIPVAQETLLSNLPVSTDDIGLVRQEIIAGRLSLTEVEIQDTQSEDGDEITFVAGQVRYDFRLTKAPRKVIVPVSNGKVTVIGKRDGGGGITMGIRMSNNQSVMSPVIQVGETVEIGLAPNM